MKNLNQILEEVQLKNESLYSKLETKVLGASGNLYDVENEMKKVDRVLKNKNASKLTDKILMDLIKLMEYVREYEDKK